MISSAGGLGTGSRSQPAALVSDRDGVRHCIRQGEGLSCRTTRARR